MAGFGFVRHGVALRCRSAIRKDVRDLHAGVQRDAVGKLVAKTTPMRGVLLAPSGRWRWDFIRSARACRCFNSGRDEVSVGSLATVFI
jgi:hypothetical protein